MTLLLGFSAVNTGNNLLFLIVSGLLAFMSVTGLAGMINLKNLTPELLPPEEIFAGTATPFRLRIRNTKRFFPSFLIRLECTGGQGVTFPLVPRSGQISGNVALSFPERGRSFIGKITVSSPFPVNFFTRYWSYEYDASVIVFPRLLPVTPGGEGHGSQWLGSSIPLTRGLDGELERISGYSGSEPLRMIHWKLSARSDQLLVKEFGRQAVQPLFIDVNVLPGTSMDERLSRAAWLVHRWVAERPVGLRLDGRTTPAEAGRRHGIRLLTELALHGID